MEDITTLGAESVCLRAEAQKMGLTQRRRVTGVRAPEVGIGTEAGSLS